jgi:carbon monoxide dehydrogenase subunit G
VTAFAVSLLMAAPAWCADMPIRSLEIEQNADGFVANVVMFAPVPVDLAWTVLTDFDHMPTWVPNVRESRIASRDADSMTVEQRGVARFGPLSFPYTSVRRMQLDPPKTIRSTQVSGSMRRMTSLMTLEGEGEGTRFNYHLELEPAGLAAALLSKDFVSHEIVEQFTAVIGEMVRRSH